MADIVQNPPRQQLEWGKYLGWAIGILVLIAAAWWLRDLIGDTRPARLVQITITGILVGGVYALIALGIVIINKASGVFNFAHGYMMFLGGLVFFSFFTVSEINVYAAGTLAVLAMIMVVTMDGWRRGLSKPLNWVIAIVGSVVLTFLMTIEGTSLQGVRALVGALVGSVLLGLTVERFFIRPLLNQPLFTIVLMTLAVDRMLSGFTQLIWGSVDRPLPVYNNVLSTLGIDRVIRIDARDTFLQGNIPIRSELVIAFVLALAAFAGFVLFFRYTNVGLAMRATAENQELAQSVGLRVRVILAMAWIIAALLATAAGVLQGGATNLGKAMPLLALSAFPAVLLGGLESIGGALIGGLVIGLVQEWANLLFPGTEAGTQLAPYVVLMVVLVIRPDGLFGQKRIERI